MPITHNAKNQHQVAMTQNVSIEREELNGVHEFVLRVDGERLGFLEFTRPDAGVMRIEYVEVSPTLRGSGLAKQLVEKAVEFAKGDSLRVVPICSYARAVIQRDPAMSAALK
ncbi:MAG TPA: GNAT family N-acetyltransferase [Vicinamibacterales bacterium]|nr:GNAT family N-acetyltransferase [Vicinamibacterales bacterium]